MSDVTVYLEELHHQTGLFFELEGIFKEEANKRNLDPSTEVTDAAAMQRLYRFEECALLWGLELGSLSERSTCLVLLAHVGDSSSSLEIRVSSLVGQAVPTPILTHPNETQPLPWQLAALARMQCELWNGKPYRQLFRYLLTEVLWRNPTRAT